MSEENDRKASLISGGSTGKNRRHAMLEPVVNSTSFRLLFLAYIVLGTATVYLDLGNTFWGQSVADFGSSLIPSIKGTSEITSAPASSATVFAIAWLWGAIMYAASAWLLFKISCQEMNWGDWERQSVVSKSVACIVGPTLMLGLANAAPTNSVGIGGKIFTLLAASPLYTVLWGIIILTIIWMGFFISTIGLISLFKKTN